MAADQVAEELEHLNLKDSTEKTRVDAVDQTGRDSTDQDAVPVADSETGPNDQSQNGNTPPTTSDPSPQGARGFVKSVEPCCRTCNMALPGVTFPDDTVTEHTVDATFNCTSQSVVYGIRCKKCRKGYVGCTTLELRTTIDKHISGKLLVDKHFKEGSCGYNAMALVVIERVPQSDELYKRRKHWKKTLNTYVPNGLNQR